MQTRLRNRVNRLCKADNADVFILADRVKAFGRNKKRRKDKNDDENRQQALFALGFHLPVTSVFVKLSIGSNFCVEPSEVST